MLPHKAVQLPQDRAVDRRIRLVFADMEVPFETGVKLGNSKWYPTHLSWKEPRHG